jgi:AraC-like DNA-binding protein
VNAVDSSAIRRYVAAGNPRARIALYSEASWTRNTLLVFVAALAALVGLRWDYNLPLARFAQPILASTLPSIAWLGFGGLRSSQGWTSRLIWPHALSIIIVAILALFWRALLDVVLVGLFVGYGIALLRVARREAHSLGAVRIGDEIGAYRATLTVGGVLVGSGLIDLVIAADFSFERGKHAATIVAIENVIALALAGFAAAVAARTRPAPDMAREEQTNVSELRLSIGQSAETERCDVSVLSAVEAAMRDRRLYRDPNLTLDRLARRIGIPSRQISAAVNRIHGRNVSQIVNEHRIAEATRLLRETNAPVTEIMLEAGFQTKSNFNREFKRITGLTPSDYRRMPENRPSGDRVTFPTTAMTPPESG